MPERYCLTALEAAELANIGLDDLLAFIVGRPDVAIKSGDSWRVDPDALSTAIRNDGVRRAA